MNPQPSTAAAAPRAAPISASLRPISAKDFGFDQARHLLWRAGFGGSPEQVHTLASWGPEKAVAHLVDYESVPYEADTDNGFNKDVMRPPNEAERAAALKARRGSDEETLARFRAKRQEMERDDRAQMKKVQHWWLKRMIETPRPLEEKMTLFWHGHFATSYRTIENSYHMLAQNLTFRRNAVGNFGELLFAIIRDPAMLAYLNNNQSRKGKPNENLAREIMELFSLGVGAYTEGDIKEGARALTGYTFRDDAFVFDEKAHDAGPKALLGQKGNLDGDGFVKAILEQRACAPFIVSKLYRHFVAETPSGRDEIDGPARAVVRDLSSTFLANKYALKPVLRRLFLSEHFYDERLMAEQIKSPAELAVGAIRSLGAPVRSLDVVSDAMNLMGQNLFIPPNVAGWHGGRSWVNTSTMFVRQNILCYLLTGRVPHGYDALTDKEKFDPAPLLAQLAAAEPGAEADPARATDYLLRFCLGRATPRNRQVLTDFLAGHGVTTAGGGRLTPDITTGLLLLMTAMPEYQLC